MPEFNPDLLFKGVSNLPLVTAFYFQPFKEVCPIFLTSFLFLVSAQPHGGALQLYIKYLHQHALKTLILFFLQSPLTHFYVTYLLQVCLFVLFFNLVTLLIILFKKKKTWEMKLVLHLLLFSLRTIIWCFLFLSVGYTVICVRTSSRLGL